jgi:MFS family permease
MVVLVLPLIALRIVDRPSDVGLYPDGDSAPPPAAAAGPAVADKLPTMAILKDINFWVIAFTTGLVTAGAAGILGNMAPLAISKGFTTAQGAFTVSAFSVGSFSSKALYAVFGDRLKARIGLLTGLFLFMISSFGFIHAETYPILVAAAFLQGLAVGTMLPLWSFLTALVFGALHVGRVFGLMTFIRLPMSFSAPPFLGWVFDRTGDYDKAFFVYIGLACASALLVTRLRAGAPTQSAAVS